MGRQYPQIDLLPIRIAGPKTNDIVSTVPLIVAWQLLRFSAKLFDDAEDENHHRAELINLGTGFLFTAQQVLLQLKLDGIVVDRIREIQLDRQRHLLDLLNNLFPALP